MSNKTEPLIISNWTLGMGESSVSGEFSDVRCVDVFTEPGLLKPGFIGNKETGTTVTDLVRWIQQDLGSSTAVYAYDEDNKLYKATTPTAGDWAVQSGNTTTSGTGNGMAIYKNHVIVARNTTLDGYKIADGTWDNGFVGDNLIENGHHMMIVGQDDILYIANGRYVATLQEKSGQTFDPGDSNTYTFNQYALDLPANYQVRCLAELGKDLMIGTIENAIIAKKTADIFPWDRISDSFGIPIRLNDDGVAQMISDGEQLTVVCGGRHSIYRTNRISSRFINRVPHTLWNFDGLTTFSAPLPGGIAKNDNRILMGFGDNTLSPHGVFSLLENDSLLFESQVSAGSASSVQIGAVCPVGLNQYLVGWKSSTAQGIDLFGTDGRHFQTGSVSYVRSKLYSVGTKKDPATYSALEIQLANALATDQFVIVKYRTDTSSSFTELLTFNYSTYSSAKSVNHDIGLTDIENIQIEVEVGTASTTNTSPKVIYVKLY